MRRLMISILSALLFFNAAISVGAEPIIEIPNDDEIIEEYQYTSQITVNLSLTNRKASCESLVFGFSGLATKVEVTHTLQKQIYGYWSDIESWSKTANTWYCMLQSSRSNLSAGIFRIKTVAKVYSGSNYETITVYSIEKSSVN